MTRYLPSKLLAISLFLAACGGGGSGGSGNSGSAPEPTEPDPPPEETEQAATFILSGAIHVSSNLSIDGDTNNPENTSTPNNSPASAQTISNPVTLGGFVSSPEPDAADPTAPGDSNDFFRVEMLAGQSVTLLVAEFEQADADLYLFASDGKPLGFSIETGQVESLLIPSDGTYIINVSAYQGATNYTLAIGSNNGTISVASALSKTRIIPWEAVVMHRVEADSEGETTAVQHRINSRMGLRRMAGGRHRSKLMGFEQRATLTQQQQSNRLGRAFNRKWRISNPDLQARWETLMTIKALRKDPDILSAEPNYRVYASGIPTDAAFPFQWHYPLINLPAAWDLATGVPEVVVAVIDTGILSRHPDLARQLVPGYDFISNPERALDGNGIDSDPEDVGDGGELGSSSFHGTHVSGTIAAASDNSIGVAGVAWNARVMPLRVLGLEGGSTYDVEQAIRFAAGLPNDSGTSPQRPADIINLSLGGAPFSQSTQTLFNDVRAAGIVVVAAAGNEGSNTPAYPAAYNGVISVSAVDSQRNVTAYSNFGSTIDIAAPGGNNGVDINGDGYPDGILSTGGSVSTSGAINFVYSFLNGTSMASPHVAGVLALMKSVNPDLSPANFDAMLAQGKLTDDLGAAGRDNRYGHGLINAQRAVVAALEAAGTPPADNPRLTASSARLNLGSAATSLDLALQNSGNGELEILTIGSPASWLAIAAHNTDDSGLGIYRINVNRDKLPAGVYETEILVTSDINSVAIEVIASVVEDNTGGDVGVLYLLLIDTQTQEVVAEVSSSTQSGDYHFEFRDIPAGSYELIAGSDTDNDFFICDPGEACGAYLTIDRPIVIEPEEDLENIEFPVEYRVAVPTLNSLSEQPETSVKRGIRRHREPLLQ
jgi:serine protease